MPRTRATWILPFEVILESIIPNGNERCGPNSATIRGRFAVDWATSLLEGVSVFHCMLIQASNTLSRASSLEIFVVVPSQVMPNLLFLEARRNPRSTILELPR